MLVKGKQTQCVDVDVSAKDIVDAVEKLYNLLDISKKYLNGSYIDHAGYWQIYEYTHPHNNDDVYNKGAKATEAELAIDKERKVFHDVLLRIKNAH